MNNTNWQLIETAPKDGTKILGTKYSVSPHAFTTICFFNRVLGAWQEDNSSNFPIIIEPTHWQPLPEPLKS